MKTFCFKLFQWQAVSNVAEQNAFRRLQNLYPARTLTFAV